jgi:hypothetical protein
MSNENELPAPKIGAIQMDPKRQNRNFLENTSKDLV